MRWQSSSSYPKTLEELSYRKRPDLAELIEGRSLAFVCPSPHLVGTDSSGLIDSHDVVVRAGNLRPHSAELHKDYGSRTDILIHSFNELEIVEARKHMEFLQSTKYIMCPMVSTDYIEQHQAWFDHLQTFGCKTENVDDRVLFPLFAEVGTICNVGFAGLLLLLKYDIKEIYVTGMSFYNMGKFGRVYTDDHYDAVTRGAKLFPANEQRVVHADHARSDIHSQVAQIEFFRRLVRADSRIKTDGYLSANLFG